MQPIYCPYLLHEMKILIIASVVNFSLASPARIQLSSIMYNSCVLVIIHICNCHEIFSQIARCSSLYHQIEISNRSLFQIFLSAWMGNVCELILCLNLKLWILTFKALNRIGLRVVLDVVYNHLQGSGPFGENSVLNKIVPGYYLRMDTNGQIENIACMNNTASEHFMIERLIIDDLLCWAVDYKVQRRM